MNAQAILSKIEEDANLTADKLLSDAQAKATELKAASRAKIETMHQAMLAQAERDSKEQEERLLRMNALDERKTLLGKKREMIDEAFALAGEQLAKAPAAEKRAFFLRQTVACAHGDETLIPGADASDWLDDAFVTEANAALTAAGKPGKLTLGEERRAGCTGVILATRGSEIRCTFDAYMEEARAELEQQVAEILFGEP